MMRQVICQQKHGGPDTCGLLFVPGYAEDHELCRIAVFAAEHFGGRLSPVEGVYEGIRYKYEPAPGPMLNNEYQTLTITTGGRIVHGYVIPHHNEALSSCTVRTLLEAKNPIVVPEVIVAAARAGREAGKGTPTPISLSSWRTSRTGDRLRLRAPRNWQGSTRPLRVSASSRMARRRPASAICPVVPATRTSWIWRPRSTVRVGRCIPQPHGRHRLDGTPSWRPTKLACWTHCTAAKTATASMRATMLWVCQVDGRT